MSLCQWAWEEHGQVPQQKEHDYLTDFVTWSQAPYPFEHRILSQEQVLTTRPPS